MRAYRFDEWPNNPVHKIRRLYARVLESEMYARARDSQLLARMGVRLPGAHNEDDDGESPVSTGMCACMSLYVSVADVCVRRKNGESVGVIEKSIPGERHVHAAGIWI